MNTQYLKTFCILATSCRRKGPKNDSNRQKNDTKRQKSTQNCQNWLKNICIYIYVYITSIQFGNYDKPTNSRTWGVIGKVHIHQLPVRQSGHPAVDNAWGRRRRRLSPRHADPACTRKTHWGESWNRQSVNNDRSIIWEHKLKCNFLRRIIKLLQTNQLTDQPTDWGFKGKLQFP